MKAEEFREKEGITDGNFWDGNEINFNAIYEFAEEYHKAKVEAISDEDIVTLIKWVSDRGFDNIHAMDIRRQYKIKIQQLLKQ